MTAQEAIAKYGTIYRHYAFRTCTSEKGCAMRGLKNGKPVCILWENEDNCPHWNENEIIN